MSVASLMAAGIFDDVETDMNRLILNTCVLIILTAIGPLCAVAWQDPFGDPEPIPVARETKPAPDDRRASLETFPPDVRVIVDSVRKIRFDSPEKYIDAVRTMMDLEEYSEARFYLGRIASQNLDAAAYLELSRHVGEDFIFRLSRSQPMAPEGEAFARKVIDASYRAAYAPARVQGLVEQLGHSNRGVRSDAFGELQRLGEPAVAAMLEVFADPSRQAIWGNVRNALHSFGSAGLDPLIAGTRAQDQNVRLESVLALVKIRNPRAFEAATQAHFAPGSSAPIKDAARNAFERQYHYFPGVPQVTNVWHRRIEELLDDREITRTYRLGVAELANPVWRWEPQSGKMQRLELDHITARRLEAADLAAVVSHINPAHAELGELRQLTWLEAAKHVAGSSAKVNAAQFEKTFPNATPRHVLALLGKALQRELVPAAIAACEVLEAMGDRTLLESGAQRHSPLVEAILYGDDHLRFAALQAIRAIDPAQNFSGSSFVQKALVQMADFSGTPRVLVGSARQDLGQTLAAQLGPSGFEGITASSGRDFYDKAVSDSSIEFLLITDTFHRPDYSELVQQLRQDWRTRLTPIAILYRGENEARADRISNQDPLTIALPFTTTPEMVALQVDRMRLQSPPWSVSADHRRVHAHFAAGWLAHLANNSKAYSWVNLQPFENRFAGLLVSGGEESAILDVLAGLGTRGAQKALVDYASQSGLPASARINASKAFALSVKRDGLLLVRKEILIQYDRYNASERESRETQHILGSILDTIESNRAQAPANG